MPETLSFLEWNSVGFYLPENFSMSLVFCSVNPRACGGVCFYLGTCTSTVGTSSCVGTGPRLLQVDYQPVVGGRVRGVYLINLQVSSFCGVIVASEFPRLLLSWLKLIGAK